MSIKDAINILSDELVHTLHHLMERGKDPEYYAELGQFAKALEMGIAALWMRNDLTEMLNEP